MLRLIYQLHKWIGVGIGLVLGLWLISGMFMAVVGEGERRIPTRPIDVSQATLSPAEAIKAGGLSDVREVAVIGLGDDVAYRVTSGRVRRLISARTGAPVTITDSVARLSAQHESGLTDVRRVEPVTNGASVRTYRVYFSDSSNTMAEVSAADASVRLTDQKRRIRGVLGNLHTFSFLRGVGIERRGIVFWTVAASILTLGSVLTGYIMALPKRGRVLSQ